MTLREPTTDPLLFTPGPLTTSRTVKAAMQRDVGSRDSEFIAVVAEIRRRLLELAGVSQEQGYEAVLMQGSGTFGIEAVVSSAFPPSGTLLVAANGSYGERIARIAERYGIGTRRLVFAENDTVDPERIEAVCSSDTDIRMLAVVHCETTSGVMNDVAAIGSVARRYGLGYFVDSMSAFGAYPLNAHDACIDFVVSSANKCIEGVPGFSFVICRRDALLATRDRARTVCLDLLAQWEGLEQQGQFRFTPPTHALLAFREALNALDAEGGVEGRGDRYRRCHRILTDGMCRMGFRTYVPPEHQSCIITSYVYPDHPQFDFQTFYDQLRRRGFVIYPGKVTNADCFRIGNIGHLDESDCNHLLKAVADTLVTMRITLPSMEPDQRPGSFA
jgi:2-aminoethylphosphonate-pyruvate transaminase